MIPQQPASKEGDQTIERSRQWQEVSDSLPPFLKDLLQGSRNDDENQNVAKLKKLLLDPAGKMLVVSNGGCRNKVGSYGFTITNASTKERVWAASGRVHGSNISSYRSLLRQRVTGNRDSMG
jgi:hypothetical protein